MQDLHSPFTFLLSIILHYSVYTQNTRHSVCGFQLSLETLNREDSSTNFIYFYKQVSLWTCDYKHYQNIHYRRLPLLDLQEIIVLFIQHLKYKDGTLWSIFILFLYLIRVFVLHIFFGIFSFMKYKGNIPSVWTHTIYVDCRYSIRMGFLPRHTVYLGLHTNLQGHTGWVSK